MKKILSLCAMALTSVGLMAQSATYTGSEKVVVGGTYTYTCDDAKYQLTFVDETLNVTIEEKSVAGTVMGDLTLGTMVIDNLTFDAEKGGYYRDYTGSDVSMTLVAVSNGETVINGKYYFEKLGNILVAANETGYHIVHNMQPGAMPFPIEFTVDVRMASANVYGFEGAGTESDPYQITKADDFQKLGELITVDHRGTGEYFKVMNDIDFGGSQLPNIAVDGIIEGKLNNTQWGFEGHIVGNHATITGVKHNLPQGGMFQSLVSVLAEGGSIADLVFASDNELNTYNYAAPFAALCAGTISGCTNYADISAGGAYAGGICGMMMFGKGTIRDCVNYGNISAMSYATGIVGGSQSGSSITSYDYLVQNCQNYGSITTGRGTGASGIAGSVGGTIVGCTNYGNVRCVKEGDEPKGLYAAGIVSCPTRLIRVEDCVNEGSVYGFKMVGGILGNDMKGDDGHASIVGCTNKGAVTCVDSYVGGVAGHTARVEGSLTLRECRNEGIVTAPDTTQLVGNLRGDSIILIENCTIAEGLPRLPMDPTTGAIGAVRLDENAPAASFDVLGRAIYRKQGLVIERGRVKFVPSR